MQSRPRCLIASLTSPEELRVYIEIRASQLCRYTRIQVHARVRTRLMHALPRLRHTTINSHKRRVCTCTAVRCERVFVSSSGKNNHARPIRSLVLYPTADYRRGRRKDEITKEAKRMNRVEVNDPESSLTSHVLEIDSSFC